MLPSQKIKFWMENRKTFLSQNKIAHLPTPLPQWVLLFENKHFIEDRPPRKLHGSAWCNGGISEFDVIDDGSNPNEAYNSSSSSLPPRPPRLNWSHFTSTSLLKSDHWSLSNREVVAQRHPGASGAIFRSLLSSKVANGHFWRDKWKVIRNRPFLTDKNSAQDLA